MKTINLLLFFLTFGALSCFAAEKTPEKKPNIIFILADDQCWEAMGNMNGEVKTPNLDKLAESGFQFKKGYNMGSYSPAVCTASRSMFNTGMSVWQCGELADRISANKKKKKKKLPISDEDKDFGTSWSQYMKSAGYTTYFAGKWHVPFFSAKDIFDVVGTVRGGMPQDTKEGYNRPTSKSDTAWLPWDKSKGGFWKGGQHWSEVLRDESIALIDQAAAKSDEPFFMYLAFNAPHDPRQSPKEYVDMYPVETIKVPENFLPEYPYNTEMGAPRGLRDEKLAPFPRTEYSVQKNRQEYYALITHLDEQIGQIIDELEAKGLYEETYIFFTADHGLAIGHHGLMGKQNMYEHSLCAPLIARGPGIKAGKKSDALAYIQDIVPTTLELAGVDFSEEGLYFESLLPILEGKAKKGRDVIYGAYRQQSRSILQNDWKLIWYPTAKVFRLFNLKKDPMEMNDLAAETKYAKKMIEMKGVLKAEMQELGDEKLLMQL